ncbi:transposable element Tcb2 transposase [Trichonephila clavipes]|uniref:Transposable element Tcb2 transposase n=1 Tax=Trichonephila clavipes TaxID=2585209 RepID=A0A8X6RZJ6_TRICX|nr:transposable element Tcb2 transposase [Trichonephila clavipes]
MSFTRRQGLRRPRQTSRLEDRHIVRTAHVQTTALLCVIRSQLAPSLGSPVYSRITRRSLVQGHLGSWCPLRVLPLTATHRRLRLKWCPAQGNWTVKEWNRFVFSDSAVIIIVFVCGNPVVNASILSLLYRDTPLPQMV